MLKSELSKKISKLKQNPNAIGKILHGKLHPSRSTRLVSFYRLIFEIIDENQIVILQAIDHRRDVYK